MYRACVVLMAAAGLIGCASSKVGGTEVDAGEVDGGAIDAAVDAGADARPGLGFGEPCLGNAECDSQVCIFVGTGGRCTRLCDNDCPSDWGCFGVIDVIEQGQVSNVCVPVVDQLCSPCSSDGECTQLGMDRCLTYPDGDRYCSRDCSVVGCPAGYTCDDVTVAGGPARQCVPASGACDCDATNAGMMETCSITTPFNTTCAGMRTCQGATGWGGCQPPSATDDPDGTYADSNCDGIDGDVARGVFVAGGGSNSPSCGLTSTTPCQTISYGIVRAATAGRSHVFVQAGTYAEVVVLVNGVNVWGGYDFAWQRASYATPGHRVEITGGQDNAAGGDGEYLAVRAHDLIVPVTMGDLVITGPAAVGDVGGNGRSSYAVHVDAATVRLERVAITAGNGAPGVAGAPGQDAVIVDAQSYMNGGRGGDGAEFESTCDTTGRGAAGPAGTNTCTSSPSSRALGGGAGGAGGTMDTSCGFTGVCAVSGNCDARPGSPGAAAAYRNGSFGAPGTPGSGLDTCGPTGPGGPGEVANGARGTAQAGATVTNGYWYGRAGTAGMTGENGSGGGGGGGAGGCDVGTDSYGGGGGGGGAGGCAARSGGGGGGGGGASFGVFAVGNGAVTIAGCTLARGAGGRGGDGGAGGRGQSGGAGNLGGAYPGGAQPGTGGNGAHGGHGGGGGGGQGGRAVGIGSTPGSTVTHDCTITGGTLGAGGSGGLHAPTAPAGERDGNNGQGGADGTLETIRVCASGTSC
ncbi:MAG: hypothetical protein R3B06_17960 [Kofleriaceae bacterium]